MSHYQYKYCSTMFCCMLLTIITGCAKAPEEVLDKINGTEEQANDFNQADDLEQVDDLEQMDDGVVYTKVSELSASVPEYMTTSIGNLSFDGTLTVPDTDCLYDLRLVPNTSFYENKETLIPDILAWYQRPYDDENIEIVYWIDNESSTYIGFPNGENPEDYPFDFIDLVASNLYIGINNCGTIVLLDHWGEGREYLGINHFWQESVMVEAYETWHLWNHEIPDIEIAFDEETVSLQELADDFSQIVELYNSQNESIDLQICTASYYLSEEQEVCVQMEAVQTYKGVCFDPVEHSDYNLVIDESGRSLVAGRLRGLYHCREDRCMFGLNQNSYIPIEELAAYDEVVSFESALELLAGRLGDHYTADIDEAALFYLRYYYGTHGFSWHYREPEPITAYAHPYWRFVERSDGNDSFNRTVYYVDAITGEVMCLYENCALY